MLSCDSMPTGVMGMPVQSEISFDLSGSEGSARWLTELDGGKRCLLTAQMAR